MGQRDKNTGIWDEVSILITGPVKIIDPHLVSSIFYYYKRVYLHYTTELENRSAWVAECSLNIQVTTRVEGNISLEGHILTQHVSIPVGSQVQYTFPELPPIATAVDRHRRRSLFIPLFLVVFGLNGLDQWVSA
nr:mannosylglycoprotein endo-beta-mannosidase [Quercus suber]